MLTQRSYSVERLTTINVQDFTKEEKEKIIQIMDIQEAKIKTFLQLQANKRQDLDLLTEELAALVELKRKEPIKQLQGQAAQ